MTSWLGRTGDPPNDVAPSASRAAGGSRAPTMAALITLLCGVGGFALASGPLGDNSFLWHLRTGRLILDHGIPRRDPYSFTAAGTHWIAQSWLAELMYGALDRARSAPFGIRIAVGLAGACIAVFLFRIAFHADERPGAGARARDPRARVHVLGAVRAAADVRPRAPRASLVFTVEVPESASSVVIPRVVHSRRDVALGERARHVLARASCTSSCTSFGRLPRRRASEPGQRARARRSAPRSRPCSCSSTRTARASCCSRSR